jgi:hypothetical protein
MWFFARVSNRFLAVVWRRSKQENQFTYFASFNVTTEESHTGIVSLSQDRIAEAS